MPRRRASQKRSILPDPKYKDLLVSKFINSIMKHGKKSIAENIFYGALDAITERESELTALETFKAAIENVMPSVEVKSRRVGGSMKKKEDTHKMAEANKAFAHYRW
jgi:small subunit ribosomal protein S7